jgi:hypothetical protein
MSCCFGDVLEHLRDPAAVLRWAREIAPRAVVSLPNIGHWTARRELLRGRFPAGRPRALRPHAPALLQPAPPRGSSSRTPAGASPRSASAGAPLPLQSRLPALGRLQPRLVAGRPELFALQVVLTCAAP